jgi:hypothetical protein
VVANVPPDTYSLEIAHAGFKTLKRTAIAVSPGDRIALGVLSLEIGATSEAITVAADAQILQTQSVERSFDITRNEVQNVPLANRNFTSLTSTIPGVSGTSRVGDETSFAGNGNSNIMMDGLSVNDSGNGNAQFAVNTESIGEIKVLVSGYQAEYGHYKERHQPVSRLGFSDHAPVGLECKK